MFTLDGGRCGLRRKVKASLWKRLSCGRSRQLKRFAIAATNHLSQVMIRRIGECYVKNRSPPICISWHSSKIDYKRMELKLSQFVVVGGHQLLLLER